MATLTNILVPRLPPRSSPNGPKLTLVMPTYRRPHLIGDSIRSLLASSFSDFELLVRDDGDGQDGTREAVEATAEGDLRVRYAQNATQMGMPGNLNGGIQEAQGEFIAVCHDHDLYKPSFLESMLDALVRYPSALFVHCAVDSIRENGSWICSHIGNWPDLSSGKVWLRFMLGSTHCPVCALTIVRREAHERYGLYDPAYGFYSDVEMWMRLSLHGDVAYVREPQIEIREREQDHFAHSMVYSLARVTARIHHRYISHVFWGPESLARRMLLEMRLARIVLRSIASMAKRRLVGV